MCSAAIFHRDYMRDTQHTHINKKKTKEMKHLAIVSANTVFIVLNHLTYWLHILTFVKIRNPTEIKNKLKSPYF